MTTPVAAAQTSSERRPSLAGRMALPVVLGLALAIRFLNYPGVFHGGEVYLFGTDSYAHLRRIWLCVLHYPIVPWYDPYVNFPAGATSIWPFGFDLLLATIARIASPGAPVLRSVEAASAVTIPFLGLVSIGLAARAARTIGGAWAGILAAVILAFLPAHILPTRLANVDHHVMELAVLAWLAARWLDAARKPSAARRVATETGLLLALSFAFWSGAHLFAVILSAGFVAGSAAAAARGARDPDLEGAQRRFLGIAAAASIPLVALSPYGRTGQFTLINVSWFHPAFLLATLAVLALIQKALARVTSLPAPQRLRVLFALLVTGGVAFGSVLLAPRILPFFGQTIAYVRGVDPQARLAAEAQPFSAFPVRFLLHFFSLGVLLSLPALALLLRRIDRARATLAGWFLVTLVLAALQPVRLGSYFGMLLAVTLAAAAADAWRARGLGRAAAAILVLCALLPGAMELRVRRDVETLDGNPWFLAVEEGLLWLRESTPPTRGWEDTRVRPDYGVLAQWSYGNWINHLARRPSVANPFSSAPWHLAGFADSIRFMIAENEAGADRIVRARRVRYVMATPILHTYLPLAASVKAPTALHATGEGKDVRYTPAFFRLVGNRLTLFDGTGNFAAGRAPIPALGHYRLVFEGSRNTSAVYTPEGDGVPTPPEIAYVKIFERVEGARLRGSARPLSRVSASLEGVTNQGRRFTWTTQARADTRGVFEVRVPYATARARAREVGAAGPCVVSVGGRSVPVEIDEPTVRKGRIVEVR